MFRLYLGLYRFVWLFAPFWIRRYLRRRAQNAPAYLHHWDERFGTSQKEACKNVIWIHAVSVGETRAAVPIVRELQKRLPESQFLITQMTPTGRATAQAVFEDVECRYLPYDKTTYVRRFLDDYQPRIGIFMETEIWPNLLYECAVRNIPTALVNARLSEKSLQGYLKAKSLISPIVQTFRAVLAQSEDDKQRLHTLGAKRITVCGNSKYDIVPTDKMHELAEEFRQRIGQRSVLVCASTREYKGVDEADLLLDAWQKHASDALLVIIPRHPERFQAAFDLAKNKGFVVQKRSDMQAVSAQTQVWIGDSMGELFAYYLIADLAFVGGSLVDTGCQNIIEPIACNVPVLYGPSVYNFAETCRAARAVGAALQVLTVGEWAEQSNLLLQKNEKRAAMSANAADFIQQHQGASYQMANHLMSLISEDVQ